MSRSRPSRERTRPTRDETRRRLLFGAATVFGEKGIGAATIEDICAEAGFSRGAFYSNFDSKDELVLALLNFNLDENTAELETARDEMNDTGAFIRSLDSGERPRPSPLVGHPELYIELVLHAYRNPANRERLVDYQRRSFDATRRLVQQIADEAGREIPGGIENAVGLIMAFDVGMSVNQLLDPDSYHQGQYGETLATLYQLWMQTPAADGEA